MGKKLIITEKPSVARDFARVLNVSGRGNGLIENNEFVITWCVGHLVEMLYPEDYDIKYKKWMLEDLPFLPEQYKYGVIENVKQQYEIVHNQLHREDIDVIYWAGDSGKEGQTIEENIRNFGGVRDGMTELRVWIDSQTDEEIRRGINEAKPMSEYALLGSSGIMRTIEDYALGINFSRALSVKYGRLINDAAATKSYTAIAVGRVMTCVLGMVVIREREIRNFVETPFYRVIGCFTDDKITAEWKTQEKSKYLASPLLYKENGFKRLESANQLIEELSGKKALIGALENNVTKKRAPLLFNLAELQAECSKLFKISPDETLQVVQDLYERKLTTYPRTDARVLTTAVAKEIIKNLRKLSGYAPTAKFVEEILNKRLYLGIEKTAYTDDSKVTDHYAIIPTGQFNELNALSGLHQKVYELITRRFLSIFYPPAEYNSVKITFEIGNEMLYASGKVLKSPGYLEITGLPKNAENAEEENQDAAQGQKLLALAGSVKVGDEITVDSFAVKEGKTSPPKRYTSGTMVLAMENAGNLIEDEELRAQIKNTGIGTSATRAEIIKKLINIGYINLNKKTQVLSPENLGEMIFEVVNLTVPSLLNPKMSASWEKGLEGITNGTVDVVAYRSKLEDYIRTETLSMANSDKKEEIAGRINQFTGKDSKGLATRKKLGCACPECGGELTTTSFGYGCSNYNNPEINCKFNVGTIAERDLSEEEFLSLVKNGRTEVLSGFVSKKKKKFSAILLLEKGEDGKHHVTFDFSENEPERLDGVTCPDCGGDILLKSFGYGCSNYNQETREGCKFAVGKIAGKELSEEQLKELLTTGKTATIRGFKSQKGVKFDACLALVKDEDGCHRVQFNFDDVEAKVIKNVNCPCCNSEVVKSTYGFRCANYDREAEDGCKFSIGTMGGKELTEAQLKELLLNGRTSTIYGFKSKSNKKFDARIALNKDEEGKVIGCKFDFEELEDKKVKDCICPLCGKDVVVTKFGYKCRDYSKEEGEGCKFILGNIASVHLTEGQLRQLLTNKKTDVISGFVAKTGMKFDAPLKLTEEGNVTFDFPEKPKPVDTDIKCPKCEKMLKKAQWNYECECGYKLQHTVAKVELSEEIIKELLTEGKTKEKISGFISKSGNTFESFLKLSEDRIIFDFGENE